MYKEFDSIFHEETIVHEFRSDIERDVALHNNRERARADHRHPMGKKKPGDKEGTESTLRKGSSMLGLGKSGYTADNKKIADDYNTGTAKAAKAFDKGLEKAKKAHKESGLFGFDLI